MFVTFAFTTVRLFETLPVSMGIGMGGGMGIAFRNK